jgi:hypothetical protein
MPATMGVMVVSVAVALYGLSHIVRARRALALASASASA